MVTQDDAMERLLEYSSYWDAEAFETSIAIFDDKVDVFKEKLCYDDSDAPDDNNLKAWVTKKIIYNHLLHVPDLSPEAQTVFVNISKNIDPIISGIRGFTPTLLEVAQEKAAHMKASITKIKEEAEDFFKPDADHTIGRARHLLGQIKSKCVQGNRNNVRKY